MASASTRDRAAACVDRAFELGINFIDTANVYGRGAAESFLGEVLAERPRNSYILATKVYFPMSATDSGLSRAQIASRSTPRCSACGSTMSISINATATTARRRSRRPCRRLSEVVRQGKARYIGFSEWSPQQIEAAFAVAGSEHFVSSQPQYSLLWRGPRRRSSRSARPRASRRSSGRRWRRAC